MKMVIDFFALAAANRATDHLKSKEFVLIN